MNTPDARRAELSSDCANCFGLCCVALPFSAAAGFPYDKPEASPCRHLAEDFRCGVHAHLRERGYTGCTVFECFGAGQKVSQRTFSGVDWRSAPGSAGDMFASFAVMRRLHELLWYLSEALERPAAEPLRTELRAAFDRTERLSLGGPEELGGVDTDALRGQAGALLRRTSELVREAAPGPRKDRAGADLMGARLRKADLRGSCFRGAYLIAADLRGANMRTADLLGADLRDTDLSGADLSDALFLTQPQVNAAKGDASTVIPDALARPAHW